MAHIHNFSAGPCILPQSVLEEASEAVKEFNGIGLSLIEISHRSKPFVDVMEEARSLVKELLNIPQHYEVLFLQGGASLAFLTTAYNFIGEKKKSAYVDTGTWASKAIKEAQRFGDTEVLASSKDENYSYIPKNIIVPSDADYFHFTSNNTIYGTQWQDFPKSEVPMICDMSSDIFSKEINASDFDMIYAGAQKNMGPAGTVLYIVNPDKLNPTKHDIPAYLDLNTHIQKDSMFNTPPVFAVYTSMLTLRWLKEQGGVKAIEKINNQKAQMLYNEIDTNPLFAGHAKVDSRSTMNVTFRLNDDTNQAEFDKMWNEAGINGLKGHRSVGGYRASMYNALPIESVEVLVQVMKEFTSKNG